LHDESHKIPILEDWKKCLVPTKIYGIELLEMFSEQIRINTYFDNFPMFRVRTRFNVRYRCKTFDLTEQLKEKKLFLIYLAGEPLYKQKESVEAAFRKEKTWLHKHLYNPEVFNYLIELKLVVDYVVPV